MWSRFFRRFRSPQFPSFFALIFRKMYSAGITRRDLRNFIALSAGCLSAGGQETGLEVGNKWHWTVGGIGEDGVKK